ncbi:hypothetical protein BH10PAT3_BH10PAT3_4850 [soil metagenome]
MRDLYSPSTEEFIADFYTRADRTESRIAKLKYAPLLLVFVSLIAVAGLSMRSRISNAVYTHSQRDLDYSENRWNNWPEWEGNTRNWAAIKDKINMPSPTPQNTTHVSVEAPVPSDPETPTIAVTPRVTPIITPPVTNPVTLTDVKTVRRFPGDPNPLVSGKAYWGAAIAGNGDPKRHELPTGASLSVRRTFWQWSAAANLNSGMFKTVDTDLKSNRLPFISIKTPGWAVVAGGKDDTQLDAALSKLDSYGKPVWFAMHHEPEGGGGRNIADDPGGATAWRAMQKHVRDRMNVLQTRNIAFMPILMSYTWNPSSGRNPEDWWVPGIWDAYIVDHYHDNEKGDMFSGGSWDTFASWVEKKGLPYGTAEWGNRGTDAVAADEMRAFWDWSFRSKKDVIVYTYFDSGLNSPNGSWELTGQPLSIFQDILKNDTRVQRVNEM